ncbi:MAG: gliding motility-associated C-terminal domain-containing protein [Bacteroidia bacterium]|nr:gliding motility-associated C-terminal domain-containing protein [Bacteroidia bacterium]
MMRARILLFLGFFVYAFSPLKATHITGAELTYTCVNPASRIYQVKLTVYRDCVNGQAAFDNNVRLFIFRGSNNTLYNTVNIPLVQTGIEVLPVDWDACTGAPYNLCVEYVNYTANVTLPALAGGYNIGWARCCRNNVVTNIFQNQGITVLAKVPETAPASCNSMPTFNQLPPLFLCVNQPFSFDHSATDANGDSLVYQISNPYTGVNSTGQGATQFNPVVSVGGFGANPMGPPPYQNINFFAGYNYQDPFSSGNFNIDPLSGLLTLTPTQTGLSVFALSVKEYRNGVLLSENKRDFQINVITCSPQGAEPVIANNTAPVPGSNGDTIWVEPTESFCYDITVSDPTAADTVILFPVSAVFGIGNTLPPPFATLTYTGTNPAIGQVCWTASCKLEGDTVMFIVGGRDTSDCPGYNIVFDTTYVIIGTMERSVISHTLPGGNADTVFTDPLDNFCYTWTGSDADAEDTLELIPILGPFQGLGAPQPVATITQSGTNPISGNICWTPPCTMAGMTIPMIIGVRDVNYCKFVTRDTVYVVISPLPPTDAGIGDTVCAGQSAPLQASGGVSYSWTPTSGLNNPNVANPIATPAVSTTYTANITDIFGCVQTDNVFVKVNPLPPAFAGNDTVKCPGIPMQLQASGGVIYSWTPTATLSNSNISNPVATPSVTTTYTVTVTDANNCVNTDQVVVFLMDAVAGPDQTICMGDSVTLTASGGVSYSWSPITGLNNPNIPNPKASPSVTTTYTVTVVNNIGCVDTDQLTVAVNPLPGVSAGANSAICIGGSTQLNATGAVSYVWSPATGLSSTTIPNPTANPTVTTTYTVTGTDANGCVNTASMTLTVNPLPIISAGNDTLKCGNTGIQIDATFDPDYTYTWTPATAISNVNVFNPVVNPLVSTNYTVSVTDENGCSQTDGLLVSVVHADAGVDDTVCVGDATQLHGNGGVSYLWDNPATLSNPSSSDPIAAPGVTTVYTLTITSVTGCTDTDQVTVVVNPLPNADAGNDQPVCIGDSISLSASGGIIYLWNFSPSLLGNNSSTPLVFPTDTTDYVVTVTDANGCIKTDTTTVLVNLLPIVDAGNDTAKCGNTGVVLSASGGVNFAWTPALGLDNPSVFDPLANPDSSTTYFVAVTDTNGCTNLDSLFVRVMYAQAGPDVPVCIYDSIQLNASGGIGYQWDFSPDMINSGTATPVVFPQSTADFYVTVTDSIGCTDRDTVTVTVNPLPLTSTSGTDPYVCSGGGTVVHATGGVIYQWMPANIFNDPTLASPIASPTYSGVTLDSTWRFFVAVTDTNGCTSLDSLDQVVRLLPIITISNDTVRCPGGTVPLLLTGGISYHWSPSYALSNPNIPNPIASPDTTTIYTGTVTAVWGCSDSAEVKVVVMDPDAGPDVTICAKDSIQLQASGGAGYSWAPATGLSNPGISNPKASPAFTTQYIVTVTDSLGCVDVDTMNVFVNQLPPADAGTDQAICIYDTVQLTASGGILYHWVGDSLNDDSLFNPQANPLNSQFFIVAVTDTNGCTARDSMFLTVNPLPPAYVGPDVTKCGEDSIQLTATGGVNYLWTPNLYLSADNISNPMAEPDSNFTYVVTVTDVNGCVNTDTLHILTMYAEAGTPDTLCFGDTIRLHAGHIGGLAVSYSWSPDSSAVNALVSNPFVFPVVTTNYVVTVTDSSGCADTDEVEIFVYPPPPANAGPDTAICIGETIRLNASGGIGYQWNSDVSLSSLNVADPVANTTVSTRYIVTVTDANGCTATDDIFLTINPLPVVDAGIDTFICDRDAALLFASGATSYLWSPGQTLSDPTVADPLAFPNVNTTYTVTGTDDNGCVNTDSVTVNVWELPVITGDPYHEICIGQDQILEVSGGVSYLWSTGEKDDRIRVVPPSTTIFWVIPYEENGCAGDTFYHQVYVERNLPRPEFVADPAEGFYPLEVNFNNQSQFSTRYLWDFGDGEFSEEPNPLHTFTEPGDYVVILTADNDIGCPASFEYRFVRALDYNIFFPTAFTPNGDGHNDEFYIVMNSIEFFEIQIFNRWGQLIFASNSPTFRWDGSAGGIPVSEGAYVYKVNAVTYRGERIQRGGSITLIR